MTSICVGSSCKFHRNGAITAGRHCRPSLRAITASHHYKPSWFEAELPAIVLCALTSRASVRAQDNNAVKDQVHAMSGGAQESSLEHVGSDMAKVGFNFQ